MIELQIVVDGVEVASSGANPNPNPIPNPNPNPNPNPSPHPNPNPNPNQDHLAVLSSTRDPQVLYGAAWPLVRRALLLRIEAADRR